jgi:hypothetical protein
MTKRLPSTLTGVIVFVSRLLNISVEVVGSIQQVNYAISFRTSPAQKSDSEAFLTKIYDVYRSPDGHIAGDEEEIAPSEEDSGSEAGCQKLGLRLRNSRSGFKTTISGF